MSTTITTSQRQSILNALDSFFERELQQVEKDVAWLNDNVTDSDKLDKRLSYQTWRSERLSLLRAMLPLLS